MKYYLLCAGLFFSILSSGQTIRTDVLVSGGSNSGVAAAIQAAHSGVKVLFVVEGNELAPDFREENDSLYSAGVFTSFLELTLKTRTDSVTGYVSPLSKAVAADILKGWTDTIKNLTIIRNAVVQKVESGKTWEIKLKDGRNIKAAVVVDASPDGALASKAGVPRDPAGGYYQTAAFTRTDLGHIYSNRIYRTSIGIGQAAGEVFLLPLNSLIAAGTENLILAGRLPNITSSKLPQPANIAYGQAAGAAAAYCAFFKTSTRNLNTRVIQGELFAYKSWLMPFADITRADSNFLVIQHIGLTGLLKGQVSDGKLLFLPDSLVSAEDIRTPMKELYSRSQLWFSDNKVDKFTLGDVLSMIKFCASRGEELNREVEKAWKTSFKFSGEYDLNHLVTRREFAVLADAYLKPFNVRIDPAGNLGS